MKNYFNLNQLSMNWKEKGKTGDNSMKPADDQQMTSMKPAENPVRIFRYVAMLLLLLTLGVGQMWADPYIEVFGLQFYESSTNRYFKTGSEIKNDLAFGNKTSDFKLVYIYANAKKNGGNLCGPMYFKWWLEGTDGASHAGGVGQTSNSWSGDYCYEKFGTENGSSSLDGLDFVKNRRPGNYTFKFYFSFEGNNSSSGCGSWYDCKYSGGDFKFTYTIPDPTITITGASSLVAGTSTDIQATITNYPVGSKITKVRVTGNLASAQETTGSATSLTVSSVTPNASGSNGITVEVTVKFGTGGTKTYTTNYNVSPPAVSDFTITPSGAGYMSSGSGTEGSPYLVAYNSTITFGLSGATKAYADGNASAEYSINGGTNYGTSSSYTSKDCSTTSSDKQNYVFKARLKNTTTSSLVGAVKSKTVYYQVPTYAITLHDNNGGSYNGSATAWYGRNALTDKTAPTRTGYTVSGYYGEAGLTNHIADASGNLQKSKSVGGTAYTDANNKWVKTSATTLYTKWTANQYDVTLKPNTGSGSNQVVRATYDAAMPTTLKAGGDVTVPTKTGYKLLGYWDATSDGNQYYSYDDATSTLSSYRTWNKTAATDLFARWQARQYTVTLDVDEDHKGTIAGATTSQTVYYDGATTTVPNRPTAEAGYGLDGYYTDQAGGGQKVINGDGTWIASVSGYTDGSKRWIHDGDATLYAYYKQAEITGFAIAPASIVSPSASGITVTPTIDPTPQGTVVVCYEIQYSNGTPLSPQPSKSVSSNVLTFTAPAVSATYRIEAKLKLDDCNGDVLGTYSTTFQVAGEHEVTVKYQDGDGRTLAASTTVTAQPLAFSEDITAPTITGYKFDHWTAGDGVTIKDGESNTTTTHIKASYAGTLTAVYAKKRVIYFNNTLGWSNVYVYFYKNSSYWSDTYGTGSNTSSYSSSYINIHGQMTQIAGTNIYYFDAEAAGVSSSYQTVTFVEKEQNGYDWFYNTKAIRRTDYNSTVLPMYVPLKDKTPDTYNGTKYYKKGYWMNYPENTGYSLLIYNQTTKDGAKKLYEFPFEFTADYTMPMALNVDLEAGQTYGFEIKRADGKYYQNTGTMTANTTNWSMTENQSSYCGLQTTAAGNYKFNLYYNDNNGDGNYYYRVGVTFPVAVNDYRIVYTDAVRWSKTATSHIHPSRVITKNSSATAVKRDTISFFWAYGSSPALKYQQCTSLSAGSASWNAGTSINVSGYSSVLTKAGVYNFIFEQPKSGGSISLVGVEPYTGSYYIRTDVAGSTKWSNYQDHDHQMTYSDYAEANSGYSHYFCHWVTQNTNVKFVVANDYSPCISDTLVEDYGTAIATIITEGNADAGKMTSANANIRFMWNQSTNKVSRAYIGGSGTITDRFLVLEGNNKMYDENGNALTGVYQDHDKYGNKLGTDNQVIMHDDENFVYERTIKVNATARAKLTAKYNTKVQYFKGSSGAFDDEHTVQLLGGTYSAGKKYSMRIVYDFKTNRLVTAYLPEGEIDDPIAINADLMIIREHQEDGQQIIFTGDGALSSVKTVYGVMRFNRWTLNNKSTAAGHAVLGDPKSSYERGLYWISFPFDVKLSDVFGFGTYGVDWIIEYYDGAERASNGYWKDSEGFWKYVMPAQRSTYVLEAGKGYVLALDLARMKDDNTEFWVNNIEQIELFFPSSENVNNISETTAHSTVDSHECTIDRRTDKSTPNINKDRTKADSHWNIIGVPSYANYGISLYSDAETTEAITWHSSPYTNDLPFLYEYELVDNTYTVHSGTTYPFKAMHAYMVQYHGDLYWKLASATPASIVARRTYAEKPQSVEFRIELQQNDKRADQTFVKLSNDEEISANFVFNEDLCKEYNGNKANIYTFIEGYIPAAGNTLPMTEQTTVVPVGVKIMTDGEYTFAIPEGTESIGVTLIDNETGLRTSLGLTDYTVSLEAGTYDERFALEISPVKQTPTGVELLNGENGENGVRKVMIDGILYIVKDGEVFDARGNRVK